MAAIDLISAPTDRLAAEYAALTGSCGLVDRSERGKLALSGDEAKAFLAGQVTNNVEALQPGLGCYAAFLTHKGKMLGDMRVLCADGAAVGDADLGEELMLDTERPALQALFDMIRRSKIGYEVELHKRTIERGLLSLIGPDAERVAGAVTLGADEHANVAVAIDGIAALAVRTDTGVDLICAAEATVSLAQALRARGAVPISEAAAEIIRVERGRPRYGIDLDDTVIPQEAGLNERAVSFTKGCYVGQETVARLYYRGKPNRHLRGLRLSESVAEGSESGPDGLVGATTTEADAAIATAALPTDLHLGERMVGRLTSAVLSPAYGPIGLALVRREAEPGARVRVGEGSLSAEVVELPFGTDQRGAAA